MIRLFVVDDHALIRDGMRALLSGIKGLQIVGDAANGQELLDRLPTTPTDVVLLDMNMPVLDGFATLPLLRERFPQVGVLVLTMLAHERYVGQAFDAGAAGYILKSTDQSEIIAAIQAVAAGKRFLCSEIGLSLLQKILHPEAAATEAKNSESLSYRELEVLRLIGEGLTNNAIAEKLFVSRRTVETHRQNILEKTQMKNTAALVKYAMDHGLLN
ncbi:response regulator [Hymenobacter sp. HD11105]|jgi:DNA-binding NarL/FixJ family response regulator